jgi:hypothetical protein
VVLRVAEGSTHEEEEEEEEEYVYKFKGFRNKALQVSFLVISIFKFPTSFHFGSA